MLTAAVVGKHDGWPGEGFFVLARSLGRRGTEEEIWTAEFQKLQGVYG